MTNCFNLTIRLCDEIERRKLNADVHLYEVEGGATIRFRWPIKERFAFIEKRFSDKVIQVLLNNSEALDRLLSEVENAMVTNK